VKKQIPLTPVLAIALAIIAAVGYFVVISPKQARSAELDEQIADLETKLVLAEPRSKAATPKVRINVADVFRLAKAMPDNDDMPGIILELNSVAISAGVQFIAIQPGVAVPKGSYDAIPITLTFEGNYYDLTDFLYRMRNLVTVRDGVLEASGRLYTLDALDLHEAEDGFPQIQAVLTVSAYSFGTMPAPTATPAAGTTTAGTGTTTGSTTDATTGATTTTTSSGPPTDSTGDGGQAALGGTG
jgi:type IV pilus assembly protein PilO